MKCLSNGLKAALSASRPLCSLYRPSHSFDSTRRISPVQHKLAIMAVDVSSITSFASIPTSTVSTLLENPTVELVTSLLQGIATKIQEYEQLKAQKFRFEVELETSVRTSESKIKVLKTSVDKALAESSRLRVDLQNSGEQRLCPAILNPEQY